ncbi:MAG: 16S rRNA (guanine(527)-N(7))-methyltransferase RsmG [Pseudomonadota bacterium]
MVSSTVSRETTPGGGLGEAEILTQGAARLGFEISPGQAVQLLAYLQLLRRWNQKIQLIGPASPLEEVVLHLLDSLAALESLGPHPGRLLDLGSGAGLPGLPLKICRPDWEYTLVESRDKKAAFIRQAVRSLALDQVRVLVTRAGQAGDGLPRAAFDLVTARALGSLREVLSLAAPYLKPGGRCLAYKGPGLDQELGEAAATIASLGLIEIQRREFTLPFLNRSRTLILFELAPAAER